MNEENLLVSSVISVFNAEKYLEESLKSLTNQDFERHEIVVINDGSTDATLSIIYDCLHSFPYYQVISRKNNSGMTKSWNEGIKKAKGRYISRHDGDDIALSNKISMGFKYMEENPEVFCVGSSALFIDGHGNSLDKIYPDDFFLSHDYRNILKSTILGVNCPILHPTVMFRKNVFLEMGGYDERYRIAADLDLWYRCIKEKKILCNIKKVLLKYRIHSQQYSKREEMEYEVRMMRKERFNKKNEIIKKNK